MIVGTSSPLNRVFAAKDVEFADTMGRKLYRQTKSPSGSGWVVVQDNYDYESSFDTSAASGISSTDISNWNTAYSWGNHASVGYLTSFTESDPVFLASAASGITGGDITSWNAKPSGAGAANRVAYWTGTNTIDDSANLTFDGTTLGLTGAQSIIRTTTGDALNVSNSNGSGTNYGIRAVTTGAGLEGRAGYFSATNATTNWSIYANAGNVFVTDKVSIGGTSLLSTAKLAIESTEATTYGAASQKLNSSSSGTVTNFAGWFSNQLSSGTGGNGNSVVTGLFGRGRKGAGSSSALNITLVGVEGQAITSSQGLSNINTAIGGKFSVVADSTNSITTAKCIDISVSNTATFVDTYGLYINSLVAGTQTNTPWSIYSVGTVARMYHAGRVNIGGTTLGGTLRVRAISNIIAVAEFVDSTGVMKFAINDTGIGFFNTAPVAKATALTAASVLAINSGDANTDTVIGNLRTRVNELEAKLQAYGLLT